ncbi:MAG: hypothetical protein RIS09_189 [Actinomycetota bacterium]|jgi:hypothetical protein
MRILRYARIQVTDERLAIARKKYDDTNDPSKYYKFKEWLHYANLQAWQRVSWHTNYSCHDERGATYLCCTCGLQVRENKLEKVANASDVLPEPLADISPLARVKHHVDFKDPSKLVCAFITNYRWDSEKNCYFWTAYCQACLDFVKEGYHQDALIFVETHDFLHGTPL